jgi:hypothetical protein
MNNLEDKIEGGKESLTDRFKLFFKGEFFKNRLILWMIGLNLFFNLANWIILWRFIRPVDSSIILHYNVYFGVDMTGDWKNAFILPLIGLIIFLINLILAHYFFQKLERIASHILLMAGFMAQLSLLVASVSVILINY